MKAMTNMLLVLIIFILIAIAYMIGMLNPVISIINTALPPGMQIPTPAPILPPGDLTPPASFSSLVGCNSACISSGYDDGTCMWPSEASALYTNIGSCLIGGSRHCGSADQCWCYCWNEEGSGDDDDDDGSGGGVYSEEECAAWAAAEGKDHWGTGEETFWDCDERAWTNCNLLGGSLIRLDWTEESQCCIWECSTD